MSTALLALAASLLVLPRSARATPSSRRARRPRSAWLVAGAAATLAVATALPPGAVVALVVAGGTFVMRRRQRLRQATCVGEALALREAFDVLAGELRAGAHPVAAFEVASDESAGTVALALRAVAARARLGVDVATGLREAAVESTVPSYWLRLASCWELAHRHGLAIGVLVRTAHREFVARERFESQFAASMAGARATAVVLAGLPLLGVALGELIGARPIAFLLSGGLGGGLLMVGTVLACAGLAWSDSITSRVST